MAIEPKKVSQLEVVETLTGEELIPIVQGGQNKSAKVKTINSSFVQELTLAELQAIQSNNLPIGQQYYVTDKQWLLYVDSPTVLKPVKGSLHIFNGETLPEGIEPDVLFIDTGIVDWDINGDTGTPLSITTFEKYQFPISVEILGTGSANNFGIFSYYGMFYTDSNIYPNVSYKFPNNNLADTDNYPISAIITQDNLGNGNSCRYILEFHRSELSFPIPAPHNVPA